MNKHLLRAELKKDLENLTAAYNYELNERVKTNCALRALLHEQRQTRAHLAAINIELEVSQAEKDAYAILENLL